MESLFPFSDPPLSATDLALIAGLEEYCVFQAAPDSPVPDVAPPVHSTPRYYEPPTQCFTCRDFGHTSTNCPVRTARRRCVYCGELGHSARDCADVICRACSGVGHLPEACPQRRLTSPACDVCGGTGHSPKDCLARKDALTEPACSALRCITCHQRSHCNCYTLESYSRLTYCCKCGARGHAMEECTDRT